MDKNIEKMKKKRFVRYADGAEMYSMCVSKFQELAKEAHNIQIKPEENLRECRYGMIICIVVIRTQIIWHHLG